MHTQWRILLNRIKNFKYLTENLKKINKQKIHQLNANETPVVSNNYFFYKSNLYNIYIYIMSVNMYVYIHVAFSRSCACRFEHINKAEICH